METMDVAPGVIVKEGGRVKQGQTRVSYLVHIFANQNFSIASKCNATIEA